MAVGSETLAREAVKQVVRPPSLTAMVIDQIRNLIITDQLAMGEQLSENSLSDRLGVSRTPVREACLKLQTERLLEVRPQRGIFVFTCDTSQIQDICELREVIETASMRLGMKRNAEQMFEMLNRALDEGRAALDRPGDYQETDHAFHSAFVNASDNRELIEAYRAVSGRARALRYRYARIPQEVRNSHADHEKMATLLDAGKTDEALTVLSGHVYGSLRNVERIMEQTTGREIADQ